MAFNNSTLENAVSEGPCRWAINGNSSLFFVVTELSSVLSSSTPSKGRVFYMPGLGWVLDWDLRLVKMV